MGKSDHPAAISPDHAGFLAAMEKARESMARLQEAMGAFRDSLAGLAWQFVMPARNNFAASLKQSMEPGGPWAGPPEKALLLRLMESARHTGPGLFIGGAPQAPGISEARRTAKATEEARTLLKQLVLGKTGSPATAVYAE